jgi:asparagine synthetase B (glutamine-hydrolysing)
MKRIKLPRIDYEKACREIGDFVIAQIQSTHSTGCVLGLSGGVDSSTTAALIKHAFDRHAAAQYELVGYILPSNLNKQDDIQDAQGVARYLGIRCETHSIETLVEAFRATNPEAFASIFHKGNLISRVRANVLSTKAATEKKMVAGTGNKDEDFGIGYYSSATARFTSARSPSFPSGWCARWPPFWASAKPSSTASPPPGWSRAKAITRTWAMTTTSWNWCPRVSCRD